MIRGRLASAGRAVNDADRRAHERWPAIWLLEIVIAVVAALTILKVTGTL